MKRCRATSSGYRQAHPPAGRFIPLLRSVPLVAFLTLAAAAGDVRAQSQKNPAIFEPLPLFTIQSYMGRCLNMAPRVVAPEVGGPEPALAIADCDGSVRQQFGIEELDAAHHVRLHGGSACVEAASATEGAAVALSQCSTSPGQVFDLDGDSILLDSNPDLVVQLKDSVTKAGTPVVLGRRLTSDVEFWDITSIDVPPRFPTSGFVTVSDGPGLQAALAAAGPNTVIQIPPGTMIEFEDLPQPLAIPEGVTLRGDRRGVLLGPQVWLSKGHASKGDGDDPGLFIMQASRSRVTGLRIRGPGRNGDHPFMKGVDTVVATDDNSQPPIRTYYSELVDHNDISDWVSAVDLQGPDADLMQCPLATPSGPQAVHVLRNYIHDNPAGYGTVAGSGAYPLVFGNTFQKNSQSLSSDGYARSGYVAVANLFMGGNGSVDADIHGPTGVPGDTNHDGGISGMAAQVVGNTFLHGDGGGRHANYCLRGLPCSGVTATFNDNVTVQSVGDSVTLIPPDKIPPVGSSGSNCIPWPEARPRVPYLQRRQQVLHCGSHADLSRRRLRRRRQGRRVHGDGRGLVLFAGRQRRVALPQRQDRNDRCAADRRFRRRRPR